MAKRVITTTEYTDDVDGSKAEGTLAFSFDGTNFEIDLSKKNRAAFEKAIKPYTDVARTVRATRTARAAAPTKRGRSRGDLAAVRAWAKEQGYDISTRGRVPANVLEAYDAK